MIVKLAISRFTSRGAINYRPHAVQLNPTINGKPKYSEFNGTPMSGVFSACLGCYKETEGMNTSSVKCAWCKP